ncbi:MAG TPA: DUF4167 domain-containing protein [Dongiaceae bacterium]|jgi:Domain of unknown function (DUF4167)
MRQGPNNRRSRGRGPRRPHNGGGGGNPRQQTFDSNGPDIRIRGNAYQVLEKYLAMARDAASAGDRIAAENFYQHAEHYYRIINANGGGGGEHGANGRFRQGPRPDGQDGPIEAPIPGEGEQPQVGERRREVVGPGEQPYDPTEDPVDA